MQQRTGVPEIDRLEAFIGEWSLEPGLELPSSGEVTGRTTFEWMPGGRFLVQRWEVSHPAAPDGLSVIGVDERRGSGHGSYRQHYFDSRGVARLYEMSFDGETWKLWRNAEDFSPLSFAQRFEGTFGEDGNTITGRWETSTDGGATWEKDFDLTYRAA